MKSGKKVLIGTGIAVSIAALLAYLGVFKKKDEPVQSTIVKNSLPNAANISSSQFAQKTWSESEEIEAVYTGDFIPHPYLAFGTKIKGKANSNGTFSTIIAGRGIVASSSLLVIPASDWRINGF